MNMQGIRRLALLVVSTSVFLFGVATPAGAHSLEDSYLYLEITDAALGGRVEMPISDLEVVLDMTFPGTDDDLVEAIAAGRGEIETYLSDNVSLGADGSTWPLTFGDIELLDQGDPADGNYVLFFFEAEAPDEIPRRIDVTFQPFFDEIGDRGGLVLIANDWQGGVIDNYEEGLFTFSSDDRSTTIDLGSTSQWSNFTASIEAGVDHIKTGPDHILFVLVLMLPAVLIFRNGWMPAHGFGSALWRILKIVTMFTVAHSITFVLAGLDWIPLPPSKFVETVIAGSIAAAALHNLRPILPNREALIAFVFGLIHGMGFASLVAELDVSTGTQLVSLLGRNLGIEIGQAVVVLLTFPALYLLRRTPVYRPVFVVGSIGLAAVAIGWMIERIFETDLKINSLVELVTAWPRAVGIAAIAAALAAVLERQFRAKGALLPVAGPTDGPLSEDPIAVP